MSETIKKQVVVVHGGDTFDTYEEYLGFLNAYEINFEKLKIKRWKETLRERLGEDFEVVLPKMPNSMNSKYAEWKIMFEKLPQFLKDDVVLLGHSLGGIFLAKYLSENNFPKKIKATFLVSAPFDTKDSDYSLGDFILPDSLENFQNQAGKIFLFHSKDDLVVPFADLEKYKKSLPNAEVMVFEDKGHFDQTEFPELVQLIKGL
jgi:hypothetical protein